MSARRRRPRPKRHRFVKLTDGNARKRKRGGTKYARVGARKPGSAAQGSVRRPY